MADSVISRRVAIYNAWRYCRKSPGWRRRSILKSLLGQCGRVNCYRQKRRGAKAKASSLQTSPLSRKDFAKIRGTGLYNSFYRKLMRPVRRLSGNNKGLKNETLAFAISAVKFDQEEKGPLTEIHTRHTPGKMSPNPIDKRLSEWFELSMYPCQKPLTKTATRRRATGLGHGKKAGTRQTSGGAPNAMNARGSGLYPSF